MPHLPSAPSTRRLHRPARRRAGLAAAAAASALGAFSACATAPPAGGGSAPVAVAAAAPGCDRPAGGGAAPPRIASHALRETVAGIVQRLQATPLTPDTAGRLRTALCDVGLWQHPALDNALAPWGLSSKQISALAPAAAASPAASPAPASGPRRIPPRE